MRTFSVEILRLLFRELLQDGLSHVSGNAVHESDAHYDVNVASGGQASSILRIALNELHCGVA